MVCWDTPIAFAIAVCVCPQYLIASLILSLICSTFIIKSPMKVFYNFTTYGCKMLDLHPMGVILFYHALRKMTLKKSDGLENVV